MQPSSLGASVWHVASAGPGLTHFPFLQSEAHPMPTPGRGILKAVVGSVAGCWDNS